MAARIATPLVLIGLAVAVGLLFDGTAATAVAIVLVGTALVVAVSIVFFEVGASEDRDRERGGRGPYG